jgi:hypothetical protein
MRISTMVFHIGNDSDKYQLAEKGDFSFLEQYGLSEEDKAEIIAEYKASNKEK